MKNFVLNVTWSILTAVLLLGLYESVRWLYYRAVRKGPPMRSTVEIFGWVIAAALVALLVQSCSNLLDR